MAEALLDRLARLEPRERGLLGLLGFVVLPLGLVFGLLLPMQEARQAAEQARDEMRALSTWVAARSQEIPSGVTLSQSSDLSGATDPEAAAPIGAAALERSLEAAQLRRALSEVVTGADGTVRLRFDTVPYGRLMTWLDGMHPGWGYGLGRLELSATETPALVRVDLELRLP